MSRINTSVTPIVAVPPLTRRVRAYVAPVQRATATPTLFDPAQLGRFALDTPPAPWIDLGWIAKFARTCGTRMDPLRTGSPASTATHVRSEIEASVSLEFETWGKLQAALACGSQQMNLLVTPASVALKGSGGAAAAAIPLGTEGGVLSTASALNVGAATAATFQPGDLVAVDLDYTGATGFVGSGVSAAYISSPASVGGDIHYIRRVTLNVGLVIGVAGGVLTLAQPLLAGVPAPGMQISRIAGFCDREGASFVPEWSALFVLEGEQGDRILFHYPRLQPMQGSSESEAALAAPLVQVRLAAAFRALPVRDANDGEQVLCFRSYLPATMRQI
ncbi:MAG: hypothetical protein M3O02_13305 [Acidobacteriota bacterium]|nr:hypothetical protein [Acidobacteriota bacterium]